MSIKEGHNRIVVKIKQPGSEKEVGGFGFYAIELIRPNKGEPINVSLIQDYGCCDSPNYHIVMKHNDGKMDVPLFKIEVVGGCAPYRWDVAGGTFTFDDNETDTNYNYLRILNFDIETDPEGDLITVTDACDVSVTCRVRICPLQNFDWMSDWVNLPRCEDEDYINPSVSKGDIYTAYIAVTTFVERFSGASSGINGAGTSYYCTAFLDRMGFDDWLQPKWVRWMDGAEIFGGCFIRRFNEDYDIIEFPNVGINVPIWTNYIIETRDSLCSCSLSAIYQISNGAPPYHIQVYRNGDWETLYSLYYYNYFTWDAFAPQCGDTRKVRVIDLCGNISNEIDLEDGDLTASGVIWVNGRSWISEVDTTCEKVINFGIQIADWYRFKPCDKSYYLELDPGSSGELVVTYVEEESICTDAILGEITIKRTRPASAYWYSPTGPCCVDSIDMVRLFVCPPGAPNRRELDSVRINVTGITPMTEGDMPDSISNGAWADASVNNGVAPYYWTIENLDEGVYGSGFSWDDAVTMIGSNVVRAANDGCGSVKLVCTDSCGQIVSSIIKNTTGVWHSNAGGHVNPTNKDNGELRQKFIDTHGIETVDKYTWETGYTFGVTSTKRGQARFTDNNTYRWVEWISARQQGYFGTINCAILCDSCSAYYPLCWDDYVDQGGYNDYVYYDIGGGKGVRALLLWCGPCTAPDFISGGVTDCANDERFCAGFWTSKNGYVFWIWGFSIDIWGCP